MSSAVLQMDKVATDPPFLAGGGKIAQIIAEFDWSSTPLGPISGWPTSIKTTVGLILRSPVAIVTLWGEQGTMIYNDAYSDFAGARHPELLGSAVREGWPEVADFNDNIMKSVLGRGETISYRDHELVLFRSGAAESVWFDLDYSPVVGEDGKPIGVIAIVVDITHAHYATERLQENEARLRFLDALAKATATSLDADTILATTTRMVGEHLGVSSCAYADMDENQDGFTIRGDWAAPGAMHILGHYSLKDFGQLAVSRLSAGLPLIINDNLKEIAPEEAATFQAIGIGATICMPLVKDGRLTALMAIHHKDPHQWTADELALMSEVTERSWAHIERVRSEAEVRDGERHFREALETQVMERTAALMRAEQALHQAHKLEALGNLTGGVAHDFNNLLMAILGSLELLGKRLAGDAGLMRLVNNAVEGAQRGKALTSRMLVFARKQDFKSERLQLADLVEGMAELLARSLGPMIHVDIRIEPDLPLVEVDPNQLEAALLNLVVNARDALRGEGTITIAARKVVVAAHDRLKPGQYVCLSVTDAGEGMDAETLARAAEPFFTTKGIGKGTGLGLSLVHGVAEESGGALILRSAPRQGTTAEVWLPAFEHAAKPLPQPSPAAAAPAQQQSRYTILAVDDDPLILISVLDMLEDLGHTVVGVGSGSEALEALARQSFDLVVTDHAMPRMTGAQLIAEIKRRAPATPIILASGYAELPNGDQVDAARLAKPFSQEELAAAVHKAVGTRR